MRSEGTLGYSEIYQPLAFPSDDPAAWFPIDCHQLRKEVTVEVNDRTYYMMKSPKGVRRTGDDQWFSALYAGNR